MNGNDAHPIFKFIKEQKKGFMGTESIKWNFSKFLLNKSGEVVKRYGSLDMPENLETDIDKVYFIYNDIAANKRRATIFVILIIGLTAGPAVSL